MELVGNTPMIYLNNFGKGLEATLVAKLELFNPYSVKDRPVSYMIREAEKDGRINKETTIIIGNMIHPPIVGVPSFSL